MSGVEQVERAARAHHSLASAFPLAPVEIQLTLRNDLSQSVDLRSAPTPGTEDTILPRALVPPRQGRWLGSGNVLSGLFRKVRSDRYKLRPLDFAFRTRAVKNPSRRRVLGSRGDLGAILAARSILVLFQPA